MTMIDIEEEEIGGVAPLDRPESASSVSIDSVESMNGDIPIALEAEELQLALNKEATEEELLKAIMRCKNLVLETDECSLERKWIVRHLIELRLRLQECREAATDPEHPRNKSSGVSKRTIKGHHFILQPLLRSTTSRYCDHCTSTIWCLVQAWYECQDCSYSCHYKCMSSVLRECAHVVTSERGAFEMEICPEVGLSAQRYKCAECKAHLELNKGYNDPKRCDYNGLYYCSGCHWNSLAIIPARVVHNWDFTPKPVCQATLQQLKVASNRPIINLESLNPKLFNFVHELNLLGRLRNDLYGMRKYLLVCRIANEDHLLWKEIDVPHLLETTNMYSLQDLVDVHSGEIFIKIQTWIDTFTKHIKVDCEICKGRGHICEVCSNDQPLYPFESNAVTCEDCHGVFHKNCFNRKNNCPKCIRLKERDNHMKDINCVDDDDE
ncbi:differentially expressed in FDCP 8 homolog [Harmonia axyridis]|uniref:differentially expressed in FDCP 8 homolog n=1 Tax=Harmonia axyridis TaxID=115357 RepID=UPI001E2750B3|nr:differentially expressed in FDCP 8 homolog [Harmonia axyridis]XP_045464924.1 differentially expressed in FDCP 8 homolog [Harmonia axyridis]